ncbi:hypothetical protein [Metabacillus litoralis]|nr:hypothetical protein [Metabacillus litoralis]MCM3413502.1 hypothetical protein [Metabacillus litoralis]
MEWSELIEDLEKEGITPFEANRVIQTYKIIESVMEHTKKIEPTEE